MKYRNLLLALLLSAPLTSLAGGSGFDDDGNSAQSGGSAIYKTTGPNGEVVFTDTPPVGSDKDKVEKVEISRTNVQPIALPRPLPTRKLSPQSQDEDSEDRDRYDGPYSIAIINPASGTTIPPGQRQVVLQVALDPVPESGYQFFAVVDGQPWRGGSSGTSLDISALERGTHSVQAVLTDAAGSVLARSRPITLYVKRPGDQVPDSAAPRAEQAPRAPAAPGVNDSSKNVLKRTRQY